MKEVAERRKVTKYKTKIESGLEEEEEEEE
jgi:hypothetical protein